MAHSLLGKDGEIVDAQVSTGKTILFRVPVRLEEGKTGWRFLGDFVRTEGKTRLYSDEDLERLEFILNLTRDLGVNLAGVEVVLGMRDRLNLLQEDLERLAHALEAAGLKDVPKPTSATGLVKLTPHGLRKR